MGDRGSWLGPPEASFVAAAGGLVDGMTSTLDSKLDGVGLSLVLDSAGHKGLLKTQCDQAASTGLKGHKCFDLGARQLEQNTKLWCLGEYPRPSTARSAPQMVLTTSSPTSLNPSLGCLSTILLQTWPLRIHRASSASSQCIYLQT